MVLTHAAEDAKGVRACGNWEAILVNLAGRESARIHFVAWRT